MDCPGKQRLFRDDFESDHLHVRYFVPRVPPGSCLSLTERPGWLRLYGQESLNSCHHVSAVTVPQSAKKEAVQICMECSPDCPEQIAGLCYVYNTENFYLFGKTADDEGRPFLTLVKSDQMKVTDEMPLLPLPEGSRIWLRIEAEDDTALCLYSMDGERWTDVGVKLDTDILTDEYAPGFTGAQFGLYCHDMTGKKMKADFDYFMAVADEG
ncbi:MAG: hypothetical protein LUF35_07120 [Lachnospiraceae bacterium]|nr:hypothetical protein [Lachnospiraceae bacterium]